MARDFSNPKKLGFMRVIQVFFAINIVITISLLVFMIKGSYTLGFADAIDYANLIFDGICFWLIWHRYRATRAFAAACLIRALARRRRRVILWVRDP